MPSININVMAKKRFLKQIFFAVFFISTLFGCSPKSDCIEPQDYIRKSDTYYKEAVAKYKELITQSNNADKLYFELGKLYFNHGELEDAIDAFRKTSEEQGKKFLSIAYYRGGNFTDALEVFNKEKIDDDEYIYYHGLTCERLNLFDEALKAYQKIKTGKFKTKAKVRIETIEKRSSFLQIADIDPLVNNILKGAPSEELYPEAGALILNCDEKIEVTSEGTQLSYLYYLIKVLNERGKEDFAEAKIEYDSTFEKVELEYARTIKPDGTVVDVGSRHIRDVSKYLNFPLYSNARVYIISFPEVAIGSCLEYKVKIKRSQLINKKDFVLDYSVQSKQPIIKAKFTLLLPKNKPLHLKIINDRYNDFGAKLGPITQEENGKILYRWEFKDIPQIIPEPSMPPVVEINPTMLISTFNDWQDIYNWWWALAKDKMVADSAIKDKVRAVIKKAASEEEKVRAIYNFCAKEIRYVAVEYGQAGYEPHYAGDIFKNKYGDCKDQAILLVTMLKEAGFKAWPVLIPTKDYHNLNPDFPSVLFNHCIAAISLKDKIFFLDPTAETCSFGDLPMADQARKVLLFKESGYSIVDTPAYLASHNLVVQKLKIKVNHDESIAVEKENFTFGFYDQAQRYWLLYTQPELIQEALRGVIQGVSIGAKLNKYNIKNLNDLNKPVVLTYDFQGPEYFTNAGFLRIMPQLASVDTSLVAKDKRRYPIDFSVLNSKETYLEIEIPKNFVLKYMPESLWEDNPWFRLSVEYVIKNSKIYFRQLTESKKDTVQQEEYPDFKNSLENLARAVKQRIVLERMK